MNTLLFNQIALRQRQQLFVKTGSSSNKKEVVAFLADLSQLGYTLDTTLQKRISTLEISDIRIIHSQVINTISALVGDYVNYIPLFKKFPEDIPNDAEYFSKRIYSFIENLLEEKSEDSIKLSCGCFVNPKIFDIEMFGACPICQLKHDNVTSIKNRKKLKEKTQLKVISFIDENQLKNVIHDLFNVKTSMSDSLKNDLKEIVVSLKNDVKPYLPEDVHFKENSAYLTSLLLDNTSLPINTGWFKTATDVLRLAVALSDGDVSLKEDSKFKLKNKYRNSVLTLLNNISNPLEDMLRFREKWLRLGEYLHVESLSSKFSMAKLFFRELRNNYKNIETFNKKAHKSINKLIEKGIISDEELIQLSSRPGEFTRKLDVLLRESNDVNVLNQFEKIVNKVATPILLKLAKHLEGRSKVSDYRYFMPKGSVAKLKFLNKDDRKTINKDLSEKAISIIKFELNRRFSLDKDKLSNVYISEDLKKIIIPLTQRSASKSLSTVERGSRINFNNGSNTIRMFMYWAENSKSGRIDVDLSAIGYDKNWKMLHQLSRPSLPGLGSAHSGDIQSAPNGASEFIDINLSAFKKANIRYVAMNVYSFTGQKFKDFECFAGVMDRKKPNSGEVYEPKTVSNKFDISSDSSTCIPLILDLETSEIIWTDITLGQGSRGRVESSSQNAALMGRIVSNMENQLPNLFDLFSAHALSRGAKIDTVKQEGISYDLEMDLNYAKNITEIMAKWI